MYKLRLSVVVALLICLLSGVAATSGLAQQPPTSSPGQPVRVGGQIKADAPTLVPAAATRALPRVPRAPSVSSGAAEAAAIPFRPTIDKERYAASKAEAARAQAAAAGAEGQGRRAARSLAPLAPPIVTAGPFDGVDQAGCTFGTLTCAPPDPHLAVGGGASQQVVEIGNSFLSVYNRSGTPLLTTSLNAFFGEPLPPPFERLLFDPRVVYDPVWNRWVLTAEARPTSPTEQFFYMAISLTDDATGPFYRYKFNVTLEPGDFFDYPQLGMDQDAIIVTANVFTAADVFKYAEAFAIAKARLYNGLDFVVPVFIGLTATTAPPLVQDQHPVSYLIAAPPVGASLALYAMRDTARPAATSLVLQANVPVAAFGFPRNADQPGTPVLIDTLDARFVNASTQVGNLLYQVHTVGFEGPGGRPTPRWYKINTATSTALVQDYFYRSDTSNDWNASIAANAADEVFVTWTADEPGRTGVYPEVRISGKQASDPAIPPGTALEVSPSFYVDFGQPGGAPARWGDYSAVALDPVGTATCAPFRQAWVANEKAKAPNFWGTTLAQIGFCQAGSPGRPSR